MVALPEDTLLAINGLVIPKASARFVRQTLTQISQAGNFRRTVNMQLRNVAPSAAMSKYRTVISCTDLYAPIWDQLRVGMVVTIDCIEPLFYAIGGTPEKTVVPNSTFEFDGIMWYRPRLTMMITAWDDDMDESQAQRSWSLEAEEI